MQGITKPIQDDLKNYTMIGKFDSSSETKIQLPKKSNWKCYLFGSYPSCNGIIYHPNEGQVPNWFIRFMMNLCFGCKWIKDE